MVMRGVGAGVDRPVIGVPVVVGHRYIKSQLYDHQR
jgi:hypothetical protein